MSEYPQQTQQSNMAPMAPKTNTMAIVGFVLAFVVNIAGLIVSIIARKQIKQSGEGGAGLALAGIIISSISIVLSLLWVALIIIAVAANPDAITTTTYGLSLGL
ncbi:DUF4190 domain-containing protein [Galactobacter caseinivorans]|uniref:DUF4190 domain-containing protein n=1 Tax=Galactobacter caseinivorans TaxID=2676123 RepID=A0A496PJL7_9MICC|nr:DUF4190 domain-containing protein [Galactobacter caseinivorans]RKW70693.1 DUF4190 domain-containing protein [Galactobacter caseinivorans]